MSIIKFSDSFYFNDWKQNPTIYYDYEGTNQYATWRKGGFEDDCILLEFIDRSKKYIPIYDGLEGYWNVYFMPSVKNDKSMTLLYELYENMYPDLFFSVTQIEEAKEHVDKFLIKASKLAIFL